MRQAIEARIHRRTQTQSCLNYISTENLPAEQLALVALKVLQDDSIQRGSCRGARRRRAQLARQLRPMAHGFCKPKTFAPPITPSTSGRFNRRICSLAEPKCLATPSQVDGGLNRRPNRPSRSSTGARSNLQRRDPGSFRASESRRLPCYVSSIGRLLTRTTARKEPHDALQRHSWFSPALKLLDRHYHFHRSPEPPRRRLATSVAAAATCVSAVVAVLAWASPRAAPAPASTHLTRPTLSRGPWPPGHAVSIRASVRCACDTLLGQCGCWSNLGIAETAFGVAYDGPALADGRMAVRDLAPALLALGDLFADAGLAAIRTAGRSP